LQLFNGDCLQLLSNIPDKSVDMILSDLPYGVTAPRWDEHINMTSLWAHYDRIVKQSGSVVLFSAQPFTTKLISSNQKGFRYCWYWLKNQGTNFFHAKRMPIRKIEEICVFGKGKYRPQMTEGHVPTSSAKGCSNGKAYHGTNKRDYAGGKTTRYPTNVLEFPCVDNYSRVHSSEKPVDLVEYLIRTYTDEGELVVDNCMGSGTTGVACKNLNRDFIGIELEPEYFQIATERIRAA
jgi:DNA modification methylase